MGTTKKTEKKCVPFGCSSVCSSPILFLPAKVNAAATPSGKLLAMSGVWGKMFMFYFQINGSMGQLMKKG